MNIEEALEKLFSLHQFGIKLGLENIQNLLSQLGNPEKALKTIHVAGSNGKGSTASFICSILIEAGLKTGLYTSPHLVKFNERIRINGKIIPDDFVLDFMNESIAYIDKNSPTFFEITTALAFKYFADEHVDVAVIETGLGGRLDATNVLSPIASVITTISEEHTNILGSDLKIIAFEKGGIIKRDSNAIIGLIDDGPKNVLIDMAAKLNTKYFLLENYIELHQYMIQIKFNQRKVNINDLALKGRYQIKNAALAILTIFVTKPEINSDQILRGLKNVIVNSGIQARYEVYNESPKVIFDAAHNYEGIIEFLDEFNKESMNYNKRVAIYGTMKDKNFSAILNALDKNFDELYVTEINYERSATIDEIIMEADKRDIKVLAMHKPVKYIHGFIQRAETECLVVLGSIYMLGEIKKNLMNI